jgi:hypothetical protein
MKYTYNNSKNRIRYTDNISKQNRMKYTGTHSKYRKYLESNKLEKHYSGISERTGTNKRKYSKRLSKFESRQYTRAIRLKLCKPVDCIICYEKKNIYDSSNIINCNGVKHCLCNDCKLLMKKDCCPLCNSHSIGLTKLNVIDSHTVPMYDVTHNIGSYHQYAEEITDIILRDISVSPLGLLRGNIHGSNRTIRNNLIQILLNNTPLDFLPVQR